MKKRAKNRKKKGLHRSQPNQWQAVISQARRTWVGKQVEVNMAAGGRSGVQRGHVESISNEGDVLIALDPGSQQAAVMCSLGMAAKVLRLVGE
jgi:hypothetical protein